MRLSFYFRPLNAKNSPSVGAYQLAPKGSVRAMRGKMAGRVFSSTSFLTIAYLAILQGVVVPGMALHNYTGGNGKDSVLIDVGYLDYGSAAVSGEDGNDIIDVGVYDTDGEVAVSGGHGNDDVRVDVDHSSNGIAVSGGHGNNTIGGDAFANYGEVSDCDEDGNCNFNVIVINETADIAVSGGDGNDIIFAVVVPAISGDMALSGGNGSDTINAVVSATSGDIAVSGGDGIDTIIVGVDATSGDVAVSGGDGIDTINAVVSATSGDVAVSGGDGIDAITVGVGATSGDIAVSGGDGDGIISVAVGATSGDFDVLGGDGIDIINVFANATSGDIAVLGGDGNDAITVGVGATSGDVAVSGGDGNDTIVADVSATSGDVDVSGGDGNDIIGVIVYGNNITDGDISVSGGNGNDKLINIGTGRVTMDGGDGVDRLQGGDGSDTLWGGDGSDTLWGGAGNDTVSGEGGADYLHGEDDADYDKLYGGTGSDVLVGGARDLVNGGEDDDILVGLDGSTRFVGGPGMNIIIDGRGLSYTVNNEQGGTDHYAVCADNRRGHDWGCPVGFACKLSDGRSPGHRQAGDKCLTACYANNITVLGNTLVAPSSCSTGQFVQASYLISFATCNYNDTLDVDLVREVVADWLGLPPCRVGVNATLGGSSSRRRHLLQLGELAEDQIEIVIESFASSDRSLQAIKDIFQSAGFVALLADLFEPFGVVAEAALAAPVREVDLASATSDPHFVSARGDRFDFVGSAERSYCVLSDVRVHVNARLMGATGASDAGTSGASIIKAASARRVSKKGADARTWMDQISVLYGDDRVLVDADSRSGTPYAASFGTVLLNGVPLEGKLGTRQLPSGMVVTRRRTRVYISVPGKMEMVVEVVRASFWEANKGPGKNFLNFQVKQFEAAGAVHGILGQSFSKQGAEVPMEGTDEDYVTSGMFAADCRFAKFAPRSKRGAARV
eukprot:jgi/Mesvir1/23648/Mv18315-RA.5